MNQDCIFCRMVSGTLPIKEVYRDDKILCFHDINPVAPVHILMIPLVHIESLNHVEQEHALVLGHMMTMARKIATQNGSPDGFRLVVNTGRVGCQEVMHLHLHILGGEKPLTICR